MSVITYETDKELLRDIGAQVQAKLKEESPWQLELCCMVSSEVSVEYRKKMSKLVGSICTTIRCELLDKYICRGGVSIKDGVLRIKLRTTPCPIVEKTYEPEPTVEEMINEDVHELGLLTA